MLDELEEERPLDRIVREGFKRIDDVIYKIISKYDANPFNLVKLPSLHPSDTVCYITGLGWIRFHTIRQIAGADDTCYHRVDALVNDTYITIPCYVELDKSEYNDFIREAAADIKKELIDENIHSNRA